MTMLFVEFNKTYVHSKGHLVKIIKYDPDCKKGYHYIGDDGISYYYNGSMDRDYMTKDRLVREATLDDIEKLSIGPVFLTTEKLKVLAEHIAHEMRLAMQQERSIQNSVQRAAIANIRTGLLMAWISTGMELPLVTQAIIPDSQINQNVRAILPS